MRRFDSGRRLPFTMLVRVGQFRSVPRFVAGVAKLASAQDLKSCVSKETCGFDPHPRHYQFCEATCMKRERTHQTFDGAKSLGD